jgi:septal ring factor EnvC (AmiA/AmiB activator)
MQKPLRHWLRRTAMKKLLICAALAVPVLPVAAAAQPYGYGGRNNEVRRELRECNRELRRADSRREYQRELRECRRELAQARRHSYRWNDRGHYRNDRYNGYYGRSGYNDRRW